MKNKEIETINTGQTSFLAQIDEIEKKYISKIIEIIIENEIILAGGRNIKTIKPLLDTSSIDLENFDIDNFDRTIIKNMVLKLKEDEDTKFLFNLGDVKGLKALDSNLETKSKNTKNMSYEQLCEFYKN